MQFISIGCINAILGYIMYFKCSAFTSPTDEAEKSL